MSILLIVNADILSQRLGYEKGMKLCITHVFLNITIVLVFITKPFFQAFEKIKDKG